MNFFEVYVSDPIKPKYFHLLYCKREARKLEIIYGDDILHLEILSRATKGKVTPD